MSTALSIKGKTQANDAVTSTINYVNPNATNTQLVSLATAMNNLTTNTIADITRIDKNSLTNTVEKLPRTLTMSQSSIAWDDISTDPKQTIITVTGTLAEITEMYTSMLYTVEGINTNVLLVTTAIAFASTQEEQDEISIMLLKDGDTKPYNQIKFIIPETTTYAAATFTLSIT